MIDAGGAAEGLQPEPARLSISETSSRLGTRPGALFDGKKPDSISSLDVLEVNGEATDPEYEEFKDVGAIVKNLTGQQCITAIQKFSNIDFILRNSLSAAALLAKLTLSK